MFSEEGKRKLNLVLGARRRGLCQDRGVRCPSRRGSDLAQKGNRQTDGKEKIAGASRAKKKILREGAPSDKERCV